LEEDNGLETSSDVGSRPVGVVLLIPNAPPSDFYLVDGDPRGLFAIDQATGRLTTAAPVDREQVEEHALTVVAVQTDRSFASCHVVVTVTDVNDVVPTFIDNDLSIIEVPDDAAVGRALYKVRAWDADSGRNGQLRYTLEDRSSYFAMDPEDGTLHLARPFGDLGRASGNTFQLKVTIEGTFK